MSILDRQRYWAFLKAYIVCFVSLVGLYVVIDAFTNLDEFLKFGYKTPELLRFIGRYYLVRTSLFFDRLCGVIALMAAIFTVTWMQKNNEHLAMLAAGVSTQRAIRPVLVSSVLFGGLAVLNQEWIIPPVAEELQRTPDDDGRRKVRSYSRRDVNEVLIHGAYAHRGPRAIEPFDATFPTNRYGVMLHVSANQAQYVPPEEARYPLRGGWLVRGATLSPADAPLDGVIVSRLDPDPVANALTAGLAEIQADALLDAMPAPHGKKRNLESGTLFLKTNLTFTTLVQSRMWYQFAPTAALVSALRDPTFTAEHQDIAVFLHTRNIRPLLSLALLGMSLPLVLGGYGRNMFVNLGLSLGSSAVFYLVVFIAQWLGSNRVLPAALAAWAPLILFGTLAAARWDRIRT
jgi:lipopolysaccharide export system permease protein